MCHLSCMLICTGEFRHESFLNVMFNIPICRQNCVHGVTQTQGKSFRGVHSRVIGLNLAGSDWFPFLCTKTLQALFQTLGISPVSQTMRKTSVR